MGNKILDFLKEKNRFLSTVKIGVVGKDTRGVCFNTKSMSLREAIDQAELNLDNYETVHINKVPIVNREQTAVFDGDIVYLAPVITGG